MKYIFHFLVVILHNTSIDWFWLFSLYAIKCIANAKRWRYIIKLFCDFFIFLSADGLQIELKQFQPLLLVVISSFSAVSLSLSLALFTAKAFRLAMPHATGLTSFLCHLAGHLTLVSMMLCYHTPKDCIIIDDTRKILPPSFSPDSILLFITFRYVIQACHISAQNASKFCNYHILIGYHCIKQSTHFPLFITRLGVDIILIWYFMFAYGASHYRFYIITSRVVPFENIASIAHFLSLRRLFIVVTTGLLPLPTIFSNCQILMTGRHLIIFVFLIRLTTARYRHASACHTAFPFHTASSRFLRASSPASG